MTRLTEWFPADVNPVHVGVYQTRRAGRYGFSYWIGDAWGPRCAYVATAVLFFSEFGYQDKEWRGLAEKPE